MERDIVAAIMSWLNAQPLTVAYKTHGNAYAAGHADILACIDGRYVALEVKQPGRKATPLQRWRIEQVKAAGGEGAVVDSLDAARAVVGALYE